MNDTFEMLRMIFEILHNSSIDYRDSWKKHHLDRFEKLKVTANKVYDVKPKKSKRGNEMHVEYKKKWNSLKRDCHALATSLIKDIDVYSFLADTCDLVDLVSDYMTEKWNLSKSEYPNTWVIYDIRTKFDADCVNHPKFIDGIIDASA